MDKDTIILDLLEQEAHRQSSTINLIASENYSSQAVRAACASTLTNKYAEGYPSKRYYAGCSIVDQVELIAIERAKKLFEAEHANVQPHSGSQANAAVYHALLEPGDTVLAMDLSAGGHLTHGYAKNSSGQTYNFVHYGVDSATETLDYNTIEQLAKTHQPKLIIAGASSYSRALDYAAFRHIADSIGALLLVDMAHIAGLIAAGLHQNPASYADVVTSTTHKTLRGPRGGLILCKQEYAERIDKAVMPGIQGGPLMHIIAAKAIAFYEALQPGFREYQQQVIHNCAALAQALQSYELRIVSDGTDTHQCTVDLTNSGISGKKAERQLESIGITANRNCIPFDTAKPWITSGIRLGTPAITSRGATVEHMQQIASIIAAAMQPELSTKSVDMLKAQVQTILKQLEITPPHFRSHSSILEQEK